MLHIYNDGRSSDTELKMHVQQHKQQMDADNIKKGDKAGQNILSTLADD